MNRIDKNMHLNENGDEMISAIALASHVHMFG